MALEAGGALAVIAPDPNTPINSVYVISAEGTPEAALPVDFAPDERVRLFAGAGNRPVLFTGKRNQSLWKLQNDYLGYSTRVNSYGGLLFDVFPPFGTEPGTTGVSYAPIATKIATTIAGIAQMRRSALVRRSADSSKSSA